MSKTEYNEKFFNECEELKDPNKIKNKIINEYFIPVATRLLKENDDYKSIVIGIGSYYSDNATEEIQIKFLPSSSSFPSWKTLFSDKNEIYKQQNKTFPGGSSYWDRPSIYALEKEICGGWYPYLGADFFVEAFVKYCPEGASQDDNIKDSHAPFMIIYKDEGEIKTRMVGELVRIWK